MKKLLLLSFLLLGLGELTLKANAQQWEKKTAQLMTPWGESLTADNVWQEYPRPKMVRTKWMNLNGVWQYFKRTNNISYAYEPNADNFKTAVLVPFPVESALSGIMDKDYSANRTSTHMYRRTFTVPSDWQGDNILLHFDAVDWRCTVYVNGKEAGTHQGGSDPFAFDITELLNDDGEQEVEVAVWDPTSDGGQPNGKQSNNPNGIWYTPSSGIWQTVWLEPVSKAHIENYFLVPDIDSGQLFVDVKATDNNATLSIKASYEGETITTVSAKPGQQVALSIPNAKLWTPDTPYIYDLDITLTDEGGKSDEVKGYFAMRKFSRGMAQGHPCLLLNNEPLYLYGTLDQGWWPDGLLTPPSYEAMIYDLKVIKQFGMNMVRKHIKTEPDLWYEWCDRNGLVVWQDMINGGVSGSIGNTAYIHENFYNECTAWINALQMHPSIGAWVVYNEGWGQDEHNGMGHTHRGIVNARNSDPDQGRLINPVTGWFDYALGDFIDVHRYPAPGASANPMNERIVSCGEFGGINLFLRDHMWSGSEVGYTTSDNSDDYTHKYNSYTDNLQSLQRDCALWSSVYTQITDVEQEVNGLLTYDRKVLKVSPSQMATMKAAIQRTINSRYVSSETVVKAADEDANITWRYTTDVPADDNWMNEGYDDSSWKSGKAGFGGMSNRHTNWNTPDIWLRRTFTMTGISPEELTDLRLWMFHDEESEVYINGVLAVKIWGYNTSYQYFSILPEALAAIKLDGSENTLAIYCHQETGGQYIDAGFKIKRYIKNSSLHVTDVPEPTPLPQLGEDNEKAYVMAYFTGLSQKLHYMYSLNGNDWKEINASKPVFNGNDDELLMRDPFIQKCTVNGKDIYHLVCTWGYDHPAICHWQSEDLINWQVTPGTDSPYISVMEGLDGGPVSERAFAPEFTYDETTGDYFIYWSSSIDGYHKFFYTRTKDWKTFSATKEYFDPGFSANDLHILKHNGKYYAFFYNINGSRNLCVATSSSCDPDVRKFSNVTRLFGDEALKVSSPATFPTLDGSGYVLYYVRDNGSGLGYSGSGNPADMKWYPYGDDEFNLPKSVAQGSVMVVSRETLQSIISAFNQESYALLPTAEKGPEMWKYAESISRATWKNVTFDDSSWTEAPAGFGNSFPPGSFINTPWTSRKIYLRHKLDLTGFTQDQIDAITGRIYYDEDVEVYLNGTLAFKAGGYLTSYKDIELFPAALAKLTPTANNVVAISCINKGGGQYIDFGLTTVKEIIPSGIESVTSNDNSSLGLRGTYNLLGQRLNEAQSSRPKGIYIINGKTTLVK